MTVKPTISTDDRAIKCAALALDKKAFDVKVLDIRGLSTIADYLVIATGTSDKQVIAIADSIRTGLKKYGAKMTEEDGMSMEYAMADSGFPIAPPAAWFDDPCLSQRTPLVVSDEGQVYGHLAAWDECHRDVTNRGCVLAPQTRMGYAPFHLGQVVTDTGVPVQVGKIVMDTRHADVRLGYAAAALHYDDTGDEVAVVRAGEDEHGIWLAGAVVPEADTRKVAKLRRSPLSGDWRAVNGHLELTAALAVNVPAFPVYAMEGDEQTALVAAGSLYPEPGGYQLPYFGVDPTQPVVDMDVLATGVLARIRDGEAQDDRGWQLRELVELDQDRRRQLLAVLRD
jgi:ribosome silencing factor RsfS/YbeB/iojap